MRILVNSVLFCLAMQPFSTTLAASADFGLVKTRDLGQVVTLDGAIEKGDAVKFRLLMHKAISQPSIDRLVVLLDSAGGDVDEAIKIGKIVRATLAETMTAATWVWPRHLRGKVENLGRTMMYKHAFANLDESLPELSKCWSACTIIFYSGVTRRPRDNEDIRANDSALIRYIPTIGVHRPSYAPEDYGKLAPAEAQKAYGKMLTNMSGVLSEMGAPKELIEQTMATPSNEIELIPSDELRRLASTTEPFFEEWLAAKCGRSTDILADQKERELFRRYIQVKEEWGDDPNNTADLDIHLVEEFGLANAARAQEISEKVRGWARWVHFCQEVTVRTVRHEWAIKVR